MHDNESSIRTPTTLGAPGLWRHIVAVLGEALLHTDGTERTDRGARPSLRRVAWAMTRGASRPGDRTFNGDLDEARLLTERWDADKVDGDCIRGLARSTASRTDGPARLLLERRA